MNSWHPSRLEIIAFMKDTLIEAEACLWQSSSPRIHDLLALLAASDEAQHFPERRRYEQVSEMTGKAAVIST
jgi:hypothetical protein